MKLLHQDPKATDPLYHRVLEDHLDFQPPSLFRDRVEELYKACRGLVDRKFASQIKHDFASCYSELYFCATFMKRLDLRVAHPSDKGPDYYLGDLNCWAEVVTVSNGEKNNPNSIPPLQYGVATNHPTVQIKLRITNSFIYKADKILEYVQQGMIGRSQRVIICINGGWMEGLYRFPSYAVGGFPEAVTALLPIGDMILVMDRKTKSFTERTFGYQDHVDKEKKNRGIEEIRTDYFLNPRYACISAVIYSYANLTDSIDQAHLGRDFFTIHNPLATNPLPLGSIRCGREYSAVASSDAISITPIEHEARR
jgi:hypothetical protein